MHSAEHFGKDFSSPTGAKMAAWFNLWSGRWSQQHQGCNREY